MYERCMQRPYTLLRPGEEHKHTYLNKFSFK
jgi:hypothetical protein